MMSRRLKFYNPLINNRLTATRVLTQSKLISEKMKKWK